MTDFPHDDDTPKNHYTRNKTVIDVQPKTPHSGNSDHREDSPSEEPLYSSSKSDADNSSRTMSVDSRSEELTSKKPGKPHKPQKPLSSHKFIAFFQTKWRQTQAFYQKNKTPIHAGAAVIGGAGIIGATIIGFWLINIWNNDSSLAGLGQEPNKSSIVYASDGTTELFRFYEEENRDVVPLDKINPNMKQSIIALEDENFYYNENGIPWSNLVGAVFKCGTSIGKDCRGASGLSQQLIKNVKKDNESSLDRKVRELFTAVKLNSESSKEEILGLYLNWVPFGRNAYGVQQASKVYFGVSASDLTLPQSCFMASMVQRPSYFDSGIGRVDSPAFGDLQDRKNTCLEKIYNKNLDPNSEKLIKSQEELDALKATEVVFVPRGSNVKYPHFKDYVSEEINKFVNEQDLLTGGYKIVTTLDPATQDAIEKSIADRAAGDILSAGANNAAAVVLDGPTGEIRAMVGSLDYNNIDIDGQVNVALAPRQPGSSIKPFVYAAAFKQGLYPGSILLDVPTTFEPGYAPKNFSGSFTGVSNIRTSLANSYNIPAVKAAYLSAPTAQPNATSGIGAVFDTATNMGVEFPCIPASDGSVCTTDQGNVAYKSRCGISASLGGCEVSMLSHASGFSTFSQDGKYNQPTPLKQIIDTSGTDIYDQRQKSSNPVYKTNNTALDPLIAREINSILSDYSARYRAFGNSAKRLELPGWTGENAVAAKTGTTNDVKDTWTVGFSPYYTVAVWVGNTDSTPLKQSSTSVGTTSGIWNDAMVYLHQNKEKKGFSKEGLKNIKIDLNTGLPDDNGNGNEFITPTQLDKLNKSKENFSKIPDYKPLENTYFANGTINIRSKVSINKLDGKIAVPGKTLPENIEIKEFNQLVAEFPAWQKTAEDLMAKAADAYKLPPTEISDQDQVAEQSQAPKITSNLDSNTKDILEINANAVVQGSSTKTIVKLEILIDGTAVKTGSNGSLVFKDIGSYLSGNYLVLIRSEDSFGAKSEKTYSNVTFKNAAPTPLSASDISSLSPVCDKFKAGDTVTNCVFTVSSTVSIPSGFRVRIGTSDTTADTSCTEKVTGTTTTVTCNNLPLPGPLSPLPGSYPIQAKVSSAGTYSSTSKTYTII